MTEPPHLILIQDHERVRIVNMLHTLLNLFLIPQPNVQRQIVVDELVNLLQLFHREQPADEDSDDDLGLDDLDSDDDTDSSSDDAMSA